MANALFDFFKEQLLTASVDPENDNIVVVLVDETDLTPAESPPNVATDDFLDDIEAAARVATSGNLASITIVGGLYDATDITLSAVSGDPCDDVVVYDNTPVTDATRDLMVMIDTATGLPVTPNGGDITVQWDSGGNRIFKV